jgi:alkyldihydroxyacetonephosphate synthase
MSVPPLGPGVPSPVFTLDRPAAEIGSRLGREVTLPEGFEQRLAGVCDSVTSNAAERVAAGRDWWPLTVSWGVAGEVPALPGLVATPTDTAQVAAVVACCNDAGVPVVAVAGRSGVCGGSVPVFGGVAVDLCGLTGIVEMDDPSLTVEVRAGTFGDHFEAELRDRHRCTLGHWPQSVALSTVGGWVACRGAGQYSTRYGKIEDMVLGLEVVLADGRVVHTGSRAPRAAAGPDLNQLFVGSEGTLGIITSARLRVHPLPAAERRGAWSFSSFAGGLDACRRILRRGATPAVLRCYDAKESESNFDLADRAVLVVLDEGDPALIDAVFSVVADECDSGRLEDPALVERWLQQRNHVPDLEALARGGIMADTVEIAGSWAELPAIYDEAVAAAQSVPGTLRVSAHQSHAYPDGACLYFTFGGIPTNPEGVADPADVYYRKGYDAILGATLAHGGALSHHHGIGINRARYLPEALGSGFDVLCTLKTALDPRGVLNPGKLGLPSPYGPAPWPPATLP